MAGLNTAQKSTAAIIVETIQNAGIDIFPDFIGQVWAAIPTGNGYVEHIQLSSAKFKRWVAAGFYKRFDRIPNTKAIEDAILVLTGLADKTTPREVYLRVAHLENEVIFDLGDTFVVIGKDGYHLVQNPPEPFRRPVGMRKLPLPDPDTEKGNRLDFLLGDIFGLDGDNLTLVTGFLIGTLGPGDYPILALSGEQGSGKTTLAEGLKRIVDPSEVNLKSPPKDSEGLSVAAANSWLLAYDNLSSVPDWLSDGLCRIASGTGFSTRRFYVNNEEVLIKHWRPIIVNSIPEIVSRGDLADRSILVNLEPLPVIQEKGKFWKKFEKMLPYILHALFTAVATALANRDNVNLHSVPRLADFTTWVEASLPATWMSSGEFLNAYLQNRDKATTGLLDYSVLGIEIQRFIAKHKSWAGSASDLLEQISLSALGDVPDAIKRMTPRTLSNELRRLSPLLRKVGISVEFSNKAVRLNGMVTRVITISTLEVREMEKADAQYGMGELEGV